MSECPRVSEIINAMESKSYLVFSNPGGYDINYGNIPHFFTEFGLP